MPFLLDSQKIRMLTLESVLSTQALVREPKGAVALRACRPLFGVSSFSVNESLHEFCPTSYRQTPPARFRIEDVDAIREQCFLG